MQFVTLKLSHSQKLRSWTQSFDQRWVDKMTCPIQAGQLLIHSTFIPLECCPPRRFKRTWTGLYQGQIGPSVSWIKFCSTPAAHIESFDFALRLAELIGSGRSNVNHTRHLAEIYDSDLVTRLAKKTNTGCFMSNPL